MENSRRQDDIRHRMQMPHRGHPVQCEFSSWTTMNLGAAGSTPSFGSQQQLQIVGEALDGLEAVRKADEFKPEIILLHIGLPKLNGLEAANRIAQRVPDSKIVFLTTQDDPDVVKQTLSNGATGYVLKVDATTELLAAIAAVLQGRRFVSRRLIEF